MSLSEQLVKLIPKERLPAYCGITYPKEAIFETASNTGYNKCREEIKQILSKVEFSFDTRKWYNETIKMLSDCAYDDKLQLKVMADQLNIMKFALIQSDLLKEEK